MTLMFLMVVIDLFCPAASLMVVTPYCLRGGARCEALLVRPFRLLNCALSSDGDRHRLYTNIKT